MARRSAACTGALVHEDPDFVGSSRRSRRWRRSRGCGSARGPARRRAEGGIDDLRAIPWVFAWTQSRIVLPAWLGLGTALRGARERHGLELLREMAAEWPFFAALLSNAEMALRQGRPAGSRAGTSRCGTTARRASGSGALLDAELELASRELVLVRGQRAPARPEPVLQASIDRRNPFVDPLSFVQIELLRRLPRRTDPDAPRTDELGRVSLLTINGIASGLRNTG